MSDLAVGGMIGIVLLVRAAAVFCCLCARSTNVGGD